MIKKWIAWLFVRRVTYYKFKHLISGPWYMTYAYDDPVRQSHVYAVFGIHWYLLLRRWWIRRKSKIWISCFPDTKKMTDEEHQDYATDLLEKELYKSNPFYTDGRPDEWRPETQTEQS